MVKEDLINLILSFKKDDFFSNVDLHIHTNESDGKYSPSDILEMVKDKDLKYFSITDHNSVSAYNNDEIKNHPNVINGVEFDCYYRGNLIHVLGYGIDIENVEFKTLLAKNKKESNHNLTRVFHLRNPKEVIDKIHLAGGIAVLAHPCCYYTFSLEKFIKSLKDMGIDGIETYYVYKRLRKYVKFHSEKEIGKIADKYNLIKTGGSDFHK